jgi:hypothetical protein
MDDLKILRNFQTALIENDMRTIEGFLDTDVKYFSESFPEGISGKADVVSHLAKVIKSFISNDAIPQLFEMPDKKSAFLLKYDVLEFVREPLYIKKDPQRKTVITLEPVEKQFLFAFCLQIKLQAIIKINIKRIF